MHLPRQTNMDITLPLDQVDTHWMFESGIMDVFIMLGPAPKDVSRLVNEAF